LPARQLLPPKPGTLCPRAAAPRISPSAILRNRRKTLRHFFRTPPRAKWNRACSNTARFTRNFAGYERQSSASEFPAERLQTLHRGTSMSISAILNSSSNQYQIGAASNPHQQKMQQLGQALQSGNLSAAQSDFATLRAAFSQPATATGSTSTGSTSNPVAQAFNQLSTDLRSGSLSSAQKDFSTLQQDLQNNLSTDHLHHHHHLSSGGGSGDSSNQNSLLQDLNQIGQSLTSSNLAGAQQAYATLQQQLQQFALGSADSSQLSNMPLSLVA
jgi:hypothetical protein